MIEGEDIVLLVQCCHLSVEWKTDCCLFDSYTENAFRIPKPAEEVW